MNSITSQPFAEKLDIQQWVKDSTQKFIDKNTNECGSGWNAGVVPDSFHSLINSNLPVGGICNNHDMDYWMIIDLYKQGLITWKRAIEMRKEADKRLRSNLFTVIDCQYQEDFKNGSWCLFFWKSKQWRAKSARYQRRGWAKLYYKTVRKCGESAIK